MDDELYQEQILDHYKYPRHKQAMPLYTAKYRSFNPLCGDELTIYLKENLNGTLTLSFTGQGCAISQASASLLLEYLQGKTAVTIKDTTPEKILSLLGVPISPNRMKCALLSLVTVRETITQLER